MGTGSVAAVDVAAIVRGYEPQQVSEVVTPLQPRRHDRLHDRAPLPDPRGRLLHRSSARGGLVGALLLLAAWPDRPANLGATLPSVAVGTALVYEIVLTAILMFVITAVATDTRAISAAAAIAIGGTVALDALSADRSPARS